MFREKDWKEICQNINTHDPQVPGLCFFLLILYSVWYFPCSVKMHVNYISKKRKQKSLCFPKNFMVIIFHRHSTKKGTIFQINTMSN